MHINNKIKSLYNRIQTEYGIKDIVSIENYKQGFLSDSFIVKSKNNKYFLKNYRQRLQKSLDFTARGTQFFFKNGIPVVLPIKTTNSEYYSKLEETSYALFPFLADINVKSRLNIQDLKTAGKMLGKIHLAGKKCLFSDPGRTTKPMTKNFTVKRIDKVMSVIEKKKSLDKIDRQFLQMIELRKKLIEKYDFNMEKYGLVSDHLIHGDYHRRNISFDNKGNINYVFDLKCLTSSRFYELTRSMRLICFDSPDPFSKENLVKAKYYLSGYNSVYPFTKKELKSGLICHFSEQFHSFWKEEEYYLRNNKTVLELMDGSMKMLEYTSKNLDKVVEKITNLI